MLLQVNSYIDMHIGIRPYKSHIPKQTNHLHVFGGAVIQLTAGQWKGNNADKSSVFCTFFYQTKHTVFYNSLLASGHFWSNFATKEK